MKEDEMVGWHHWLNGHEFEQAPGDSEGQRNLACCGPWGHRIGHDLVTEQWTTNSADLFAHVFKDLSEKVIIALLI